MISSKQYRLINSNHFEAFSNIYEIGVFNALLHLVQLWESEIQFHGERRLLKYGQMVISAATVGKLLNIERSKATKTLQTLETQGYISRETSHICTEGQIITILDMNRWLKEVDTTPSKDKVLAEVKENIQRVSSPTPKPSITPSQPLETPKPIPQPVQVTTPKASQPSQSLNGVQILDNTCFQKCELVPYVEEDLIDRLKTWSITPIYDEEDSKNIISGTQCMIYVLKVLSLTNIKVNNDLTLKEPEGQKFWWALKNANMLTLAVKKQTQILSILREYIFTVPLDNRFFDGSRMGDYVVNKLRS